MYIQYLKFPFCLIILFLVGNRLFYSIYKTESENFIRENFAEDLFADESTNLRPTLSVFENASKEDHNQNDDDFFDSQFFPGIIGPSGPTVP